MHICTLLNEAHTQLLYEYVYPPGNLAPANNALFLSRATYLLNSLIPSVAIVRTVVKTNPYNTGLTDSHGNPNHKHYECLFSPSHFDHSRVY